MSLREYIFIVNNINQKLSEIDKNILGLLSYNAGLLVKVIHVNIS